MCTVIAYTRRGIMRLSPIDAFNLLTHAFFRRVYRVIVPATRALGSSNSIADGPVGYPWAPNALSIASARQCSKHAKTMRSIFTCEDYGRARLTVSTIENQSAVAQHVLYDSDSRHAFTPSATTCHR